MDKRRKMRDLASVVLLIGAFGSGCGEQTSIVQHKSMSDQQAVQQVLASKIAANKAEKQAKVDFELPDYEGHRVSMKQFRGKPTVVTFWTSWCPSCRQEMPMMAQAARDLQGKVQFVGVNLADQDKQGESLAVLHRYHWDVPNLRDETGAVAELFAVRVIPTHLLLNEQGVVVKKWQGPLPLDELKNIK